MAVPRLPTKGPNVCDSFLGMITLWGDECLCYTNVYYVYPPCTFTDWMAMVLAADKYLESFC